MFHLFSDIFQTPGPTFSYMKAKKHGFYWWCSQKAENSATQSITALQNKRYTKALVWVPLLDVLDKK